MEKILFEIQKERDEMMVRVKSEESKEYQKGYFDGILDAYNLFKKQLERLGQ